MDIETQIGTGQYTSVPPRRAFNIYGAAEYCSCRCAAIEEAIRDGRLRARRLGRGFIITREDLDAFIDLLPAVEPHTPPSILRRRQERAQGNGTISVFADRQVRSVGSGKPTSNKAVRS